jgi:hypothetical protein
VLASISLSGTLQIALGVIVGGLVTWFVNTRGEALRQQHALDLAQRAADREDTRAEAAQRAIARSVARVLQVDLIRQRVAYEIGAKHDQWPAPDAIVDIRTRLSIDDYKTLAAQMTLTGWHDIQHAQLVTISVPATARLAAKKQGLSYGSGSVPLANDDRQQIADAIAMIDTGINALAPLAIGEAD